ncbi:MAG: hypothetical protein WBM83_04915 [Flavobacteriaceae bacterium]
MKLKNSVVVVFFLFIGTFASAQNNYESEHRILKAQFPEVATSFVTDNTEHIKNLKFYKEVDTASTRFSAKFKKDRLKYHMDFDADGALQKIGFQVKVVDLSSDLYSTVESYFLNNFETFKVKRIFQEYGIESNRTQSQFLKDAFQNMILPSNKYRFLIVAKKNGKKTKYDALFDGEGNLKRLKQSLPANHDRVLY